MIPGDSAHPPPRPREGTLRMIAFLIKHIDCFGPVPAGSATWHLNVPGAGWLGWSKLNLGGHWLGGSGWRFGEGPHQQGKTWAKRPNAKLFVPAQRTRVIGPPTRSKPVDRHRNTAAEYEAIVHTPARARLGRASKITRARTRYCDTCVLPQQGRNSALNGEKTMRLTTPPTVRSALTADCGTSCCP